MTELSPKPAHANSDHDHDQRDGCSPYLVSATVDRGTDAAPLGRYGSASLRSAIVQPSQDDGCVSCRVGRRGFGVADQGIQRREAVWHVATLALARPGEQRSGAVYFR
jgi:hypothetical protein